MDYTTTIPLNDCIADLRPGESPFGGSSDPGDVRRRTDHSLNVAYELLLDHRDGATAPELIRRAAEQVHEATATLARFRERLERLAD